MLHPRSGPPEVSAPEPSQAPRRWKVWELSGTLHCSIIGTCLSTAELRVALAKLKVPDVETCGDHELHKLGVTLAGRPDAGAKLLHKALDRRHEATIRRYAKARDEAALLGLWQLSVRDGEIPGAYWATLTHPVANQSIVRKAFGDVHMLSHLVGAATRADIRRLRLLEEDNARLRGRIEKQQRQIRDGFTARDGTIRRLNEALARRVSEVPADTATADEDREALRLLLKDMERRLATEGARRERLENRCASLAAVLSAREQVLRELRSEVDLREREIDLIESQLAMPGAEGRERSKTFDLHDMTVLYVGGRAHLVPQLRAVVERCRARLLDHDGGVDHSAGLLPGLVSRADVVLFPVDCVSHGSATRIKRLCRQQSKPFYPLRTSSLSSFMAALSSLSLVRPAAVADARA
jgi:uncharacterized protein DUF2325